MAGREISGCKWTTWEDLILVCLVKEYGLESWDKVSMEFPKHARFCPPQFFTPHECMSRFPILHHQFLSTQPPQTLNDDHDKMIESMEDFFRKIRMEDLLDRLDDEKAAKAVAAATTTMAAAAATSESKKKEDVDVVVGTNEYGEIQLTKEDSGRGGGDDIQTGQVEEINQPDPVGESPKMENGIPVVEANKDEEILLTKGKGGNGGSGDNKTDRVKEINESDPIDEKDNNLSLIDKRTIHRVLKRLQLGKNSKLLYHKLHSQKNNESYKKIIREHIDLDIIQSKVNQEEDTYPSNSFFRDLLLMFNNAIAFFDKDSQEHVTATKLREVAREEMEKINLSYVREYIFALPAPSSPFAAEYGRGRRN